MQNGRIGPLRLSSRMGSARRDLGVERLPTPRSLAAKPRRDEAAGQSGHTHAALVGGIGVGRNTALPRKRLSGVSMVMPRPTPVLIRALVGVGLLVLAPPAVRAADAAAPPACEWPRWRGADGTGQVAGDVPV